MARTGACVWAGVGLALAAAMAPAVTAQAQTPPSRSPERLCRDLILSNRLTLIYADVRSASEQGPAHCYVKGLIGGSITFHAQLPFPDEWNGRLLHRGDGGADGDLDFGDRYVARGYATVNSNTGHDVGAEGLEFGFRNQRAREDFAYRAVHFTTNAGKTLVQAYYGKPHELAYHDGCSTGGRQGLIAAQLFPYDFDGIIAGAPATLELERAVHRISLQQRFFANDFAGNLAYDADGDGKQESLAKVDLLAGAVLDKCDLADGIEDGILEPPLCDFTPAEDLPRCADGRDAEDCFTAEQIASIEHIYGGTRDREGELIYAGVPFGSERRWSFIPHVENDFVAPALRLAQVALTRALHHENPRLLPPDPADVDYALAKDAALPEWGWWEFRLEDLERADIDETARISRGGDPRVERFLLRNQGKLLLYHGWADAVIPPQPTVEYHEAVLATVFEGDREKASQHMRLFMAPGMAHCGGGPGPNAADYLGALDRWVTEGEAPERIVAQRRTNGAVDNERPLCPYPERAVYVGPAAGVNDPSHWTADNFECR